MSDVRTVRTLCARDETVRSKLLHALASSGGIVLCRGLASETRLRITEMAAKPCIDLRMYCDGAGGEYLQPTPNGLSLDIDLLPDLLEALTAICDELPTDLLKPVTKSLTSATTTK